MTTYKRGDRVMLAAFEDQPEEAAVVLERQRRGMYTVQVEAAASDHDDGIRELYKDQILRRLD